MSIISILTQYDDNGTIPPYSYQHYQKDMLDYGIPQAVIDQQKATDIENSVAVLNPDYPKLWAKV